MNRNILVYIGTAFIRIFIIIDDFDTKRLRFLNNVSLATRYAMHVFKEGIMKRKERTKILVHCDNEFLKTWADRFEKEEKMQMIEEPSNALTMIKMRESAQNSLFYLGEVLVSETRVSCKGKIGIGIVQGNALETSYYLAVIDAGYHAELTIVQEFEKELKLVQEQQSIENQRNIDNILKTRVQFETMEV